MKTYFYIAIGALALAVVMLGLTFVPAIGVYTLIASVLSELCALAFLNTQKRKNNFKGVFIVNVIAYILLAMSAALFVGGLIYVAMV